MSGVKSRKLTNFTKYKKDVKLVERKVYQNKDFATKSKFFDVRQCIKEGKELAAGKALFTYVIIGDRSIGKSTSTMNYLLEECREKDREFVYLRRSLEEIKEFKRLYANANHNIKIIGNSFYDVRDNKLLGHILALSQGGNFSSGDFNRVHYIMFDEFISQSYQYLTFEYRRFISAFITICRDGKDYFETFLLGNRITHNNPYLIK
ncbi:MAG: phage DNA encapsidation protein [Paraclostridium sp.]